MGVAEDGREEADAVEAGVGGEKAVGGEGVALGVVVGQRLPEFGSRLESRGMGYFEVDNLMKRQAVDAFWTPCLVVNVRF